MERHHFPPRLPSPLALAKIDPERRFAKARPGSRGITGLSIASMTGFARAEGAVGDFGWTWELKSVNGRNLDLRCRFPAGYEHLDGFVRTRAAESLKRGNIAVTLTVDDAASQGRLSVNREALSQVLAIVNDIGTQVPAEPARLDGLLGLKGVLEIELPKIDEAEAARRT